MVPLPREGSRLIRKHRMLLFHRAKPITSVATGSQGPQEAVLRHAR
jgi:hypothetical protein